MNAVSMSITISYGIQTAKGREREREKDNMKKKIIRIEKRIEKRCCFLQSLSV